ncbi:MAG: uL30 family ribosomal protein [Candidatus Micrarchaeia archaeon]
MKDLKNNLIAVVRVRGRVKVRKDIQETLDRLHLKKPNNCVILKANDAYIGMIKKANDYIAYGEVSNDVLEKIVKKKNLPISAPDFSNGEKAEEVKKYFPITLRPPSRGYRKVKQNYKVGGALGYMGDEINSLLLRMI